MHKKSLIALSMMLVGIVGGYSSLTRANGSAQISRRPLAGTPTMARLAADMRVGSISANRTPTRLTTPLNSASAQYHSRPVRALRVGRTTTHVTYFNADGTHTARTYLVSHFYRVGKAWKAIDNTIVPDRLPRLSASPGAASWAFGSIAFAPNVASGSIGSNLGENETYTVRANSWRTHFAATNNSHGMVRITQGTHQLSFIPVGAAAVSPSITYDSLGKQTVRYENVWPGVSLVYSVNGDSLKESIVVARPGVANAVAFRVVGAKLLPVSGDDPRTPAFTISGALGNQFAISRVAPILNLFGYDNRGEPVSQVYRHDKLTIRVDPQYLHTLPAAAFPVSIDPSVYRSPFGTRAGGNYVSFKTDGTICYSNVCNLYAGSLYDQYWRLQWWRGAFFSPYELFRDPNVYMGHADLHLTQRSNESFWTGTWEPHWFQLGHAVCLNSFNCLEGGAWWAQNYFASPGDIDATGTYETVLDRGDFGAWMMVGGEDGTTSSFKNFDPNNSFVEFTYTHKPYPSSLTSPGNGASVVTDQPYLTASTAGDADGDPVQYRFKVTTNPDLTGGVVDSGWLASPQFTVPAGVLQDGQTYYWAVQTWDGLYGETSWRGGSISNSAIQSFKIDLRNGKDATQAFDDVGPVSVDAATGNLTTTTTSHSIAALGGSLGLSATFNSPVRSRQGLVGQYWNLTPGNGIPSTPPNYAGVDGAIDFAWGLGSPQPHIISEDWFGARWTGYFIAPATGNYFFGGNNDDSLNVTVAGSLVYSNGGCYNAVCYGASVYLTAGQIAPIKIEYQEATGPAYVHLYVKGAVSEQVVPTSWFRTDVSPITANHGLTGSYYYSSNNGVSPTFPANSNERLFLRRLDSNIGFAWGLGAPVANGPTDNFMARWTGYFTAPATGEYRFGTVSDDGSRLWVNGTQTVESWVDQGLTLHMPTTPITLTQGQSVPITLEYYEHGGGAQIELRVNGPGINPETALPAQYLSPKVQVLPDGWNLGLDADGNLGYDFAQIGTNSVILRDSSGQTHEYKWNGSAYTPPVNETGTLVRNTDGTLTLQDEDGRTYIFNPDGTLQSATTPLDDRHPAALRYTYSGTPARLTQITDGVDSSRSAQVLYAGNSSCPKPPAGFVTPPENMICAVTSSDGAAGGSANTTDFFYINDSTGTARLARIVRPGGDTTDYGYDTAGTGLMTSVRDALANDAVTAGVRANDETTITQIGYDILGRATAVTLPAPAAKATRLTHSYEYGDHVTLTHLSGAIEPHGFTRKVTYDNSYRTLSDTDVAGLTTNTVWDTDPTGEPRKDLVLSTTDPSGLMSTTLYDYADRPTDEYGPAPASWFTGSRIPTGEHVAETPHKQTGYDENMHGLAASYYTYSATSHNFTGAPLGHDTALGNITGDVAQNWGSTAPVPVPAGNGWGVRLTGDIRMETIGTYNFRLQSDDGVRLYVDNHLVIDDWNDGATRSHSVQLTVVNNLTAGSYHPVRIDYYNKSTSDNDANLVLYMTPPGGTETSALGLILVPHYGLETKSTTFDSSPQVGDSVTTTAYGSHPELGLAQSTTVDPGGLNYTMRNTYEEQGAVGSYLRQLSQTRPGGSKTEYRYYGATETADNPCTQEVTEAYKQAGMQRLKIEPGLAGNGNPRTTETVYNEEGRAIATRVNQDPWTCISYDARGRVTQTVVPAIEGRSGRTILSNWSVGGNPLVTSTGDNNGTVTTTSDLLDRIVQYVDARGDTTNTTYDALGRMIDRTGPLGHESFAYDETNRLSGQLLEGILLAKPSYDAFGRLQSVSYPTVNETLTISRDALGRPAGMDYLLADGTTHVTDSVTRSQSGQIVAGTENGLNKRYEYDKDGRLVKATIGNNTYSYSFATTTSCGLTANPNAGADGNRTSVTATIGTTATITNYCYDEADRLLSSTNPLEGAPQYDPHGNTIRLGGGTNTNGTIAPTLNLGYDASDRNVSLTQGTYSVTYARDVQNRVTRRSQVNGTQHDAAIYGFTGTGEEPDLAFSETGKLGTKFVQLPGGTLLTIRSGTTANAKIFSLINTHGDTMASTDGVGKLISTYTYDPFGTPTAKPKLTNGVDGAIYGWVGQHQKMAENTLSLGPVQMGARVYLPTLGRFATTDPVAGGTEDNYVYPTDPVNEFDLNGDLNLWGAIGQHSQLIGDFVDGVGVGACVVLSGGWCGVFVIATAVVGGVVTTAGDRAAGHRWVSSVAHGGFDAGVSALGGRGLRAVRWFGNGRNYRSFVTALARRQGRKRLRTVVRGGIVNHAVRHGVSYWWSR